MQNEAIGNTHYFVPDNRLAAIGLANGHAVKHVWHTVNPNFTAHM
jgi:hypothetical protein